MFKMKIIRSIVFSLFLFLSFSAKSVTNYIVVADQNNAEWKKFADIIQSVFQKDFEIVTYDEVASIGKKSGGLFYGIWVDMKAYYGNDTGAFELVKNFENTKFTVKTENLRILFGQLLVTPALNKKSPGENRLEECVFATFPKNPVENDWKDFYTGGSSISQFVDFGTPEIIEQQFKLLVTPAPELVAGQFMGPIFNYVKNTKKYLPNQPVYISRTLLKPYQIRNKESLNFQMDAEEEYLKDLPPGSKFVSEAELTEAIKNKENFYFIFSVYPHECFCYSSAHQVIVMSNDNIPKYYGNLHALLKMLMKKMN